MSVISYNEFVPANPVADSLQRAVLSLGNAVLFLGESIVKAYKQAATRSQLKALSADQLEDIGLERSDIDAAVARI